MQKMEEQLPIPVRLDSAVRRMLQGRGLTATRGQEFEIKRVFYFGDEGGIMCDVTPTKGAREAVLVSLTHLLIPAEHSLAQEIRAYQRERVRRIAQSAGRRNHPALLFARARNGVVDGSATSISLFDDVSDQHCQIQVVLATPLHKASRCCPLSTRCAPQRAKTTARSRSRSTMRR